MGSNAVFEREIKRLKVQIEDHLSQRSASLHRLLMPHQVPIFLCGAKHIVLAKGRRWGGTRGAAIFVTEAARRGSQELWVDTSYNQMIKYIGRYFLPTLRNLPKSTWKWNQQNKVLSFSSGGVIDFGSADRPDLLEGFGYHGITINEAGHVLKDEKLYFETLLPMGGEHGGARWLFVGTPKPGSFLFHQLFLREEEGRGGWRSFQRPTMDNPLIGKEEIEGWREVMPELTFRREILGEFLLGGGEFFTSLDGFSFGYPSILPTDSSPFVSYVMGVDLAKTQDWTVVWLLRLDAKETDPRLQRRGIACWRWQKVPWPETIRRLKELSSDWGRPRMVMDATGIGSAIVDDMQQAGLSIEPLIFTNASKIEICNRLAADVEQGRLSIFEHPETLLEMRLFQCKVSPGGTVRLEAPAGKHDDCVMALAMANGGLGRPSGGLHIYTQPSLFQNYPSLTA